MSQAFPVRFGRSTGIAAVFEAPRNAFGWKGAGSLSVDAEGVRIAKGGRAQHIGVKELASVYREADALRFDIERAAPPRREILWLWARSPEVAAEIVKLLPTRNTVEIEHQASGARGYRLDWRVVLPISVVVAAFAFGLLALVFHPPTSASPDPSAVAVNAEEMSSAALEDTGGETEPGSGVPASTSARANSTRTMTATGRAGAVTDLASRSRDVVTSTGEANEGTGESAATLARAALSAEVQSAVDYAVAQVSFRTFLRMHDALRAEYLDVRNSTDLTAFSSLEGRWWRLTVGIYTDPWGRDSDRFLALAISRSWRMLLTAHVEAIYRGDMYPPQFVVDELAFADLLTTRLRGAPRLED